MRNYYILFTSDSFYCWKFPALRKFSGIWRRRFRNEHGRARDPGHVDRFPNCRRKKPNYQRCAPSYTAVGRFCLPISWFACGMENWMRGSVTYGSSQLIASFANTRWSIAYGICKHIINIYGRDRWWYLFIYFLSADACNDNNRAKRNAFIYSIGCKINACRVPPSLRVQRHKTFHACSGCKGAGWSPSGVFVLQIAWVGIYLWANTKIDVIYLLNLNTEIIE